MGPIRFLYYAAGLFTSSSVACGKAPTATTRNGTYSGLHLAEFNQDIWRGIPFAKAPVLDNPQSLTESWEGIRAADKFGDACLFNATPGMLDVIGVSQSSDCLNLNIIRPSGYEDEALPVVVWFYGGSFAMGAGADEATNTSYVIQASVENGMPIMSVTFNYRVGFLGFPGGYQAAAAGITNLGLKDQRAALRWVQENIAGFGGDPDKVTLWGQSAGAISIGHQILAHGGEGADELFKGAILVSGAPFYANYMFPTLPVCLEGYESALEITGCAAAPDTLECLRKANPETISNYTVAAPFAFWPSIDGDFVREPPAYQFEKGLFSKDISIITGSNSDEGLLTANTAAWVENDEQMTALLTGTFTAARESTIQELLAAYPADAPSPPYSVPMDGSFCEAMEEANLTCGAQYRRVAAIFGDQGLISGSRLMAQIWASQERTAYSYRFDTNPTAIPIVLNSIAPGFATHSAEYSYFFGFPPEIDRYGRNPTVVNVTSHLRLSRGITEKFISYISTGDPNAIEVEDFPEWPVYSVEEPVNFVMNATIDALNVHIEPDTWRETGMAIWGKYPVELQPFSPWRP